MTPETLDRVATIAGAVLTILIFSYLLGDNFLYRIAIHIFIGAAAAYTRRRVARLEIRSAPFPSRN